MDKIYVYLVVIESLSIHTNDMQYLNYIIDTFSSMSYVIMEKKLYFSSRKI